MRWAWPRFTVLSGWTSWRIGHSKFSRWAWKFSNCEFWPQTNSTNFNSHLRPVLLKEKAWTRVWNGWATRCRTRNRNLWLWSCPEVECLSTLTTSKIFSYFSDCDYNFHVYKFYIGVRKERNCFVFHSPCPPSSCTPPVCCVSSCFGFGDSTEVKTYFRSSKKQKKRSLT